MFLKFHPKFLLILATLPNINFGEIQSQAFSGLNHFIPIHARTPLYKLQAQKNRYAAETADKSEKPPFDLGMPQVFNNCSINIGNVVPGQFGSDQFNDVETTVFIDGDVVNASDCGS